MKHINHLKFYDMGDVEIVSGTSSHAFPSHIHQCFCIGLITKGKVELICQDLRYILNQGSIFFISPFMPHSISSINNEEYGYITFCLRKFFLDKYNHFNFPHIIIDEQIYQHLFYIYNSFIQSNQTTLLMHNICDFMCNLASTLKNKSHRTKEHIMHAKSYIDSHIDSPFNLQEISNNVYITKYHLIRQFKAVVGISPYQYYIYKKVILIKQGLLKQQVLSDLAAELEFSDQSHLNKIFKKHMGITPLQFYNSYKYFPNYNNAGENFANM